MRQRYIALEGCIGVGKTTLAHLLARHMGARLNLEIVEENPFLPLFYQDRDAHALKTQLFFLLSRYKQQETLIQDELFSRGTVSDYLFAKDRIFAELTLNSSELALYGQIYDVLNTRVPKPDLVVFLQAPLESILGRIKRRGRSFERNMDVAYLESLVTAYQRFFAHYTETPLLVVDTAELNFADRPEDFQRLLEVLPRVKSGSHRFTARDAELPLAPQRRE
ncbi:MAG: deoxynucleoside kinase [Myxococcota bacterium]